MFLDFCKCTTFTLSLRNMINCYCNFFYTADNFNFSLKLIIDPVL